LQEEDGAVQMLKVVEEVKDMEIGLAWLHWCNLNFLQELRTFVAISVGLDTSKGN
jgi:hypothetical protein